MDIHGSMQTGPSSSTTTPRNSADRLIEIGFKACARWVVTEGKLQLELAPDTPEMRARLKSRAALYAFVSDGLVLYVGKTALTLERRFAGYRSPTATQSTNLHCNARIKELVATGREVQILMLAGLTPLQWGEFELNIAAGLEDSLIAELAPPWNGGAKPITESEAIEREAMDASNLSESDGTPSTEDRVPVMEVARNLGGFPIVLGETYFRRGIINPGANVSDLFGKDGELMTIRLGEDDEDGVQTTINRRANANGSPRLFGSRAVAQWFQANFALGDVIRARVVNPNEIVLLRS